MARILIVEDNVDIRRDLAELFRFEGFHVSTASDGVQALELLNSGEMPDLIFLDLMMPKMDGYEFVRQIRTVSKLKSIPVVVLSCIDPDPEMVRDLSPARVFLKPAGMSALLECVKNLAPSG